MIELIMHDYLVSALSPVPVLLEVPKSFNHPLVVIEKTGSRSENKIDSAVVVFQSYGPSMYEAATLNEQVKSAVLAAVELDSVASVRLNSDYNYTDTATKRYRYQAVFDITYYCEGD